MIVSICKLFWYYSIDPSVNTVIDSVIESELPTQAKKPKILDGKYYAVERVDEKTIYARCTDCGEVKKGSECSTGKLPVVILSSIIG